MKTDNATIQDLHQTYCSISKMDVGLRYNRESSWVEFLRSGFTKADLEAVLKRLIGLVEAGERRPECLKFSNVVEMIDRFEEELAMVKAEANGLKIGERSMSVMELRHVVECKEALADQIKDRHAKEDAFGLTWLDETAHLQFSKLRSEISLLKLRISKMA